jgi:putative Holliday junction resolvase
MPAGQPGMSGPTLSYLAFDYGLKRVGVATGNNLMGQARPLCTIEAQGDARFAQIGELIAEWRPDALIVGVPFHPDGAPHDNTARARKFIGQLRGRHRLPVHEVDERYSTTEAIANGARDLDAASAAILLQQFFDDHPQALQPDPAIPTPTQED